MDTPILGIRGLVRPVIYTISSLSRPVPLIKAEVPSDTFQLRFCTVKIHGGKYGLEVCCGDMVYTKPGSHRD